jgi:hypothetical protein
MRDADGLIKLNKQLQDENATLRARLRAAADAGADILETLKRSVHVESPQMKKMLQDAWIDGAKAAREGFVALNGEEVRALMRGAVLTSRGDPHLVVDEAFSAALNAVVDAVLSEFTEQQSLAKQSPATGKVQ